MALTPIEDLSVEDKLSALRSAEARDGLRFPELGESDFELDVLWALNKYIPDHVYFDRDKAIADLYSLWTQGAPLADEVQEL